GNLLFESSESLNGRTDCGGQGVQDTVSRERLRGIRIYDIADMAHPKLLTTVQTCRGADTHTVATDPNDAENVYIYISRSAPGRPGYCSKHLLGSLGTLGDGPGAPTSADTAMLRQQPAHIVAKMAGPQGPRRGPQQRHDIPAYPAIGLAGGACGGYGVVLDIR